MRSPCPHPAENKSKALFTYVCFFFSLNTTTYFSDTEQICKADIKKFAYVCSQ